MVNGHKKFLALSHVVLIIVTILCVLPFYLLIVASFTDETFAVKNGFSLMRHAMTDANEKDVFIGSKSPHESINSEGKIEARNVARPSPQRVR